MRSRGPNLRGGVLIDAQSGRNFWAWTEASSSPERKERIRAEREMSVEFEAYLQISDALDSLGEDTVTAARVLLVLAEGHPSRMEYLSTLLSELPQDVILTLRSAGIPIPLVER